MICVSDQSWSHFFFSFWSELIAFYHNWNWPFLLDQSWSFIVRLIWDPRLSWILFQLRFYDEFVFIDAWSGYVLCSKEETPVADKLFGDNSHITLLFSKFELIFIYGSLTRPLDAHPKVGFLTQHNDLEQINSILQNSSGLNYFAWLLCGTKP